MTFIPPPIVAIVFRKELIELNITASKPVKPENIVALEPKYGCEYVLNNLPIQNSKFSFVLYPNSPANGIIVGLHRSSAQFAFIFLTSNIVLIPYINTNIIIIISIKKNKALLNDHSN